MKMKKARLFIGLFAAVILLVSFCGCDEDEGYPKPAEQLYINDFSGVMSSSDSDEIERLGEDVFNRTTAQIAAVTIKTTDGEEIADYALNLGREWGVGDKDKDNGIVILLATEDREIYIAVGYGLEGALPDSKVGRLIDHYGLEYFSDDEFSVGLKSLYEAIANEVYIEYGIEPTENYTDPDTLESEELPLSLKSAFTLLAIAAVILMILFFNRHNRFGGGFYIGGRGFGSPHGFGGSGHSGGHSGGFGGGSFGGGGAGRGF